MRKSVRKRMLFWSLLFLFVIMIFISWMYLRRSVLDSEKYFEQATTFELFVQTTAPYIADSTLSNKQHCNKITLAVEQPFSILPFSNASVNELYNGNAEGYDYHIKGKLFDSTHVVNRNIDYGRQPQNNYLFNFTQDLQIKSLEKGYYLYYFSWEKPTDLIETLGTVAPLVLAIKNCYTAWIPIKTSDNNEDITLGLRGNLPSFGTGYFNQPSANLNYADENYILEQNYFLNSIEFLANADEQLEDLIDTGIFGYFSSDEKTGDHKTIDYLSRYNYLQQNPVQSFGFMIYADESFIQEESFSQFHIQYIIACEN